MTELLKETVRSVLKDVRKARELSCHSQEELETRLAELEILT